MPGFLYYAYVSGRQARHSAGFLTGWLGNDDEWGFWTSTVWDSLDAMRAFRNSGVHLKAMPKLLRWCDEASLADWEHDTLPEWPEAEARLRQSGRLSRVRHPSPAQARGETMPGASQA